MSTLSKFFKLWCKPIKDDRTASDAQKYIKRIVHTFAYMGLRVSEITIGLLLYMRENKYKSEALYRAKVYLELSVCL